MTSKTKTEGITLLPYRERVKLVRERLASMRHPETRDLPKPAKVLAAEKVVEEWQRQNRLNHDQQYTVWRQRKHEVQDALILGDTEKAVKLLKALGA